MTIPPNVMRSIQATTTDEVFLVLLTIAYTNFTHYVVSNTENITSRGNVYVAWPFTVSFPRQYENTQAKASLEFDNVDPAMWKSLRQLDEIPSVLLEVVVASAPDTVLMSCAHLKMRTAQATARTILAELFVDSIWQTGYPAHDYFPGEYPGLFGNS